MPLRAQWLHAGPLRGTSCGCQFALQMAWLQTKRGEIQVDLYQEAVSAVICGSTSAPGCPGMPNVSYPSCPVSARWPLVGSLRFLTAMGGDLAAMVGCSSPLRISMKRRSSRIFSSRNLR